ncbi:hypothetical protein [Saccharopolyspora shandongensis]|uniref:hypothetical protein n=1 Tax=Saccharopolyspora shandongensis TaxID=418495 RepID=UPI0033CED63D
MCHELAASYPAVTVEPDSIYVRDAPLATAAGVSAGIDMGLRLAAELWGEDTAKMTQLILEYDPQPPFDTGSPEKAGPALLAAALKG